MDKILKDIANQKLKQSLLNDNCFFLAGKQYILQDVILWNSKACVSIPVSFQRMSKSTAVAKYPSEYRPEIIYSNDDGTISITFDMTDTDMDSDDLPIALIGIRSAIKRLNPANTFFTQQNKNEVCWFDYRSYALDGDLYNILFITHIHHKLLMGSFSCPFEDRETYELFAERIISSLKEIKEAK